jgi:beta-galactosidase
LFYAVLRFFAQGGKGINYYMFYGGTNYDQLSMYLQTTSYDYDAPIDEYGRRREKYFGLQYIHKQLEQYYADFALSVEEPQLFPCEDNDVRIFIWKKDDKHCVFLCNDHPNTTKQIRYNDKVYDLAPLSVQMLVNNGLVILKSDELSFVEEESSHSDPLVPLVTGKQLQWQYCMEDIPIWTNHFITSATTTSSNMSTGDLYSRSFPSTRIDSKVPVEMLRYTGIATDYAWYVACYQLQVSNSNSESLEWLGGEIDVQVADYVQVYVNGIYTTSSPLPLMEERFPNDWNETNTCSSLGFHQHMEFTHSSPEILKDFSFCISFLVSSLGMIKGDWQLERGWNMKDERKGLLQVPKIRWKIREKKKNSSTSRMIPLQLCTTFQFRPLWMQLSSSLFTCSSSYLVFDAQQAVIPKGQPRWYRATIELSSLMGNKVL